MTKRLDEILSQADEACKERSVPMTLGASLSVVTDEVLDVSKVPKMGATEGQPSKRSRSVAPPRVLLVDDNLINLRIIRMYCEKRGLQNVTAVEGFEAIKAYEEGVETGQFSLILLDLQMPNCDGVQACSVIRALEKEKNLQPAVIFMGMSLPIYHRRQSY